MATKTFNTRIVSKHDTTANWELATSFIPKAGEIIIYTDGDTTTDGKNVPRIKVGDGENVVSDLRFIGSDEISELKSEINYLHPVSITSFSVSPSVAEKGSTVSSETLTYKVNRMNATCTIDGTAVTSSPVTRTDTVTADKTYTLKAALDTTSVSATAKIVFYNGVYYGVGSTTSATQDVVAALTKKLQASKGITFTVNAGSGQYILFALPVSMGTPSFKVGGFDGGFELSGSLSFTNASGYAENYNLYKSVNASLGSTTVVVS